MPLEHSGLRPPTTYVQSDLLVKENVGQHARQAVPGPKILQTQAVQSLQVN